MCGIFCHLASNEPCSKEHIKVANKIGHRGPDNNVVEKKNVGNGFYVFSSFHRLCINGLDTISNQPIHNQFSFLMCNGEIYNYKQLISSYNLKPKTNSDCEVILLLYQKTKDIVKTIRLLDGVFACVIVDTFKKQLHVARDPIGVRPLFYTESNSQLIIGSELKCVKEGSQFPPNTIHTYNWGSGQITKELTQFIYALGMEVSNEGSLGNLLIDAVDKRVQNTDRPLGLLLSGGLDSSIIASLAAKKCKHQLHSFSFAITPEDGDTSSCPDIHYAQKVADFIGTKHHTIKVSVKEALQAIPEVIKCTETYDITTIRASTPMWLLMKWIAKNTLSHSDNYRSLTELNNTDIKVLLSGEGSDEIFGGYLYFHYTNSEKDFQGETERLVNELHMYDVLRADRCTAAHGLELRVPFLDKALVNHVLRLPPQEKMCYNRIEKYILRKFAQEYNLLPEEIIWRQKDAFSDAVGFCWVNSIKEHVKELGFTEAEWYLKLFEEMYPNKKSVIKGYWMPKWTNADDPSATALDVHNLNRSTTF